MTALPTCDRILAYWRQLGFFSVSLHVHPTGANASLPCILQRVRSAEFDQHDMNTFDFSASTSDMIDVELSRIVMNQGDSGLSQGLSVPQCIRQNHGAWDL